MEDLCEPQKYNVNQKNVHMNTVQISIMHGCMQIDDCIKTRQIYIA